MEKNLKMIPKTVKPLGLQFVEQNGNVTGVRVAFEVNYGTSGGQINPDIWDELNVQQRELVQNIFDKLTGIANEIVAESV